MFNVKLIQHRSSEDTSKLWTQNSQNAMRQTLNYNSESARLIRDLQGDENDVLTD